MASLTDQNNLFLLFNLLFNLVLNCDEHKSMLYEERKVTGKCAKHYIEHTTKFHMKTDIFGAE